ncbi:hypothetical protein CsatA_014854 [Cannabis sativa]
MEKLLSTKRELKFVPECYKLPPDCRPGNTIVPICEFIPVIDFKEEQPKLIQQIIHASKQYGFFQLINHGVEEKLLKDVLDVAKEFFELPGDEEKERLCCDMNHVKLNNRKLLTSIDYMNESLHYWRDALRLPSLPLEYNIQFWPQKPPIFREVIGSYSVEVRKLSMRILDLISKGLGLENGYFYNKSELCNVHIITLNHYPPCPDPSLTLGLPKHSDPNLITLLLQQMDGLQILKDQQWFALKPFPNAFVVNVGHILEILSNGKVKSVEHRVVTNKNNGRTTVGSFIYPCPDCQIEPTKALINDNNPPLYKQFTFKDFMATYVAHTSNRESPLKHYQLQPN